SVKTDDLVPDVSGRVPEPGDEGTGDAPVPEIRCHVQALQFRCFVRKSLDPATPGCFVSHISDEEHASRWSELIGCRRRPRVVRRDGRVYSLALLEERSEQRTPSGAIEWLGSKLNHRRARQAVGVRAG